MTIRTTENADAIVDGLGDGVPLRKLCRDLKISWVAVYAWRAEDAEFAERIAHARAQGHDAIAEDCLEIADDLNEKPESRKVRIWARLQLLSKWDPKRYGDKQQVELSGSIGVRAAEMGDDDLARIATSGGGELAEVSPKPVLTPPTG